MEKFTKGPWKQNNGSRILSQWGIGKDLFRCMLTANNRAICTVVSDGFPESEQAANAELIAAAPDLYEACRLLILSEDSNSLLKTTKYASAVTVARAALSKVTA